MPDYVLVHHGIKGMKWGVRRFQNKDGSLTAAGRARQRLQDAVDNRKAKKAEAAENERVRKLMSKPIRKLSAAELAERTTRAEQERRLRDIERQSNDMAKNAASFTKKLGGKLLNEAVVPALVNAGKNALSKKFEGMLSDVIGLNAKDAVNSLDLLSDHKLSELSDKQIAALKERATNMGPIKKMFGIKDKDVFVQTQGESNNKPKNESNNKPKNESNNKPKNESNNKPKDENKPESKPASESNPVNKPQKPYSTEKTVDADYKETSSYVPSNSNARSTHEVFKEMYPDNISKLSGYKMTSISQLENYKDRTSNARAYLDDLKGYKMSSLDDLEKYN